MEVPLYNSPQVAPAGLPNAQIQGLSPRQLVQGEIAGHEQELAGQNAMNMAQNNMNAEAKAQLLANQIRVDAALNNVRAAQQKLTYDPETGYLSQKGAAAVQPNDQGMGLQDQFNGKLKDAITNAAADLSNDAQRTAFMRQAQGLSVQFDGQVQSHVLQEYRNFGLQTQQGTVALAGDIAAKNWNNPDVIDLQIQSAKAAVWKAGMINGEPGSLTQAKIMQTTSGIHSAVINEALQNNNPQYAQTYIQKYKDDMVAGDLLRAQGAITADMQGRIATGTAQQVMDSYKPAMQPTASDRFVEITRQAESRGKDFAADGTPLTSPKGAKYGMQVMPDTAKAPGFGIKPAANDSPEEYNRVGAELLGALVKKYAGDAAKTWAAYNAGMGNVDKAIADAGQGGDWMAALAKYQSPANHQQTLAYVTANVKQLQAGGGAQPMPTLQDVHQKIRDSLGPNADPQTVAKALQAGTQLYSDQVKANEQRADQLVTKAQQYLAQNRGDYNSLPPDIRSAIVQQAPDQLPKLMSYANSIANPPKADNMAAYHEAFDRPDLLAKMSDSQFAQFAMTNFTDGTQKQLARIRQDAISGKVDTSPGAINEPVFKRELTNRMQAVGLLDRHGKPLDPDQAGTLSNFLRAGALSVQQQTGQKMTEDALIKYIDGQFLKSTAIPGMLWGSTPKPTFAMRAGDIPSSDLSQIKEALAKQGNTNPSNDQILRTYWAAKAR